MPKDETDEHVLKRRICFIDWEVSLDLINVYLYACHYATSYDQSPCSNRRASRHDRGGDNVERQCQHRGRSLMQHLPERVRGATGDWHAQHVPTLLLPAVPA